MVIFLKKVFYLFEIEFGMINITIEISMPKLDSKSIVTWSGIRIRTTYATPKPHRSVVLKA